MQQAAVVALVVGVTVLMGCLAALLEVMLGVSVDITMPVGAVVGVGGVFILQTWMLHSRRRRNVQR